MSNHHSNTLSNGLRDPVPNTPPTASIIGAPDNSPEGTAIILGSSVTDPSLTDTAAGFSYAWSVTRDGNPYASGTDPRFAFTPNDNGTYVVSLQATDKDGGVGTALDQPITVPNVSSGNITLNAPV